MIVEGSLSNQEFEGSKHSTKNLRSFKVYRLYLATLAMLNS